jgi:serine/threonine protein kinase/Tfp pilus assembly protein PilF
MSLPPESEVWAPSVARHVDALCDRFEAAHRAGGRPRIGDYLAEAPAPEQPALLRELLALDLAYRSRGGEAPTPEEYARQFPAHAALIREVFRQAMPGPAVSTRPDVEAPSARAAPGGSDMTASGTLLDGPGPDTEREMPAAAPETRTHPPGPDVPGYEVLGILGQGGMGIVYQARQVPLRRLVALKMLRATDQPEPGQLERFRAEAEAVARLQHPHIVQIYEVGAHGGLPYLALEYVVGGSLAQRLEGAPLPPGQAARLLETVARAIHYAHQQGVVHRDLKPANILLQGKTTTDHTDGTDKEKAGASSSVPSVPSVVDLFPKITDFGLAKRLDVDTGQTRSGAILGTPSYMAPEQAAGKTREIGPAADVYALGVILYEALTGRPPFRGATVLDTLAQVLTREPVPPSRLQPGVPRDLETICLKCLRKEPPQRYASAEALADDLRRFRAGEPIRARPAPAWERAWKWARRHKTAAALIAVLVAAAAGLTAGSLWYYQHQAFAAAREVAERRTVQDLLSKGDQARAKGNWQSARNRAGEALALIQNAAPTLDDRKADAERLRDEAQRQLAAEQEKRAQEQARRRVIDKSEGFHRSYDEAQFHGTLFSGVDLVANVRASEKAALTALGEFGVALDSDTGPRFEGPFTPPEKTDITARCYELLLILAEGKAQQGPEHAGEALRILDRAAKLAKPTRAYHLRRARYLDLLRDAGGARKETAIAEALAPAGALDHFLMGDDRRRQGNVAAAIGHFQDALGSDPGHFWARYFLAVCYLSTRPNPDARAAKDSLTVCLNQREFVWGYVLRGFAHGELNEFSAAEEDFGKAARLDPHDEDVRYAIALGRGILWMLRKKYPEAVAEFEKASRLRPKRYEPYRNLATVYERQKRPDLAVAQLDRAVAVAGAEPAVLQLLYHTRAGLHDQQNDPDAELSDLRRAIALESAGSKSPQLAEDHFRCGQLLLRRKRCPEALTAYEAALKVQPTLAAAQLGRCEALLALERYEEVVRTLNGPLPRAENGKESAKLYRLRGVARAWRLDYAGAVEDYTRALNLQRDAETLARRGWVYLFQDALAPALHDFQEALERDPNNGDAYGGRGYARARLGQYRRGVEDAETALACRPENRRDARMLCLAARVFAQAVGRMDAEHGRPSREALEQRAGYQDRALDLLRSAVALQPAAERRAFWGKIIAADPALQPIRGSSEYGRLAAALASGDR